MIVWQHQFLAIIEVFFFPYSSHMDQFLGFVTSLGGFDNAGNYTIFLSQLFFQNQVNEIMLCVLETEKGRRAFEKP